MPHREGVTLLRRLPAFFALAVVIIVPSAALGASADPTDDRTRAAGHHPREDAVAAKNLHNDPLADATPGVAGGR